MGQFNVTAPFFLVISNAGHFGTTAILDQEANEIREKVKIRTIDNRPPLPTKQHQLGLCHMRQVK